MPIFATFETTYLDTRANVFNSVKIGWFLSLRPITYDKTENLGKKNLDPPPYRLNSIQGVPSFNYTIYSVLKGEVKFLSTFLDIFEGPKLDECS